MRARGLSSVGDRFEILYGGRTNRVWRLHGHAGDLVLKLYRTDFHNPLFRNDPMSERACLERLADTGLAPRLRATGKYADQAWALYDHAPGAPWQDNTRRAAEALARLHSLEPGIDLPSGRNGSCELLDHAEDILALCAAEACVELQRLRPTGGMIAPGRTSLIHGDPVPGNLLLDAGGVVLIDWQCPAIGDPAEDIAIFLSPAMQHVYRGKALTIAEERSFLAAYAEPEVTGRYQALKPFFHWRMAAYCLWRAQNGAPDYAPAYRLEVAALTE